MGPQRSLKALGVTWGLREVTQGLIEVTRGLRDVIGQNAEH